MKRRISELKPICRFAFYRNNRVATSQSSDPTEHTIPNAERALDEIDRVLKPTGEFRFLEHVRSEGLLGKVQDLAAPLWKVIGAGCHLNRQTKTLFANSQLEIVEIETLDIGVVPVKRFIRGRAVPKRSTESS